MTQCPNCHQYMDSYTEYSSKGKMVTQVCTCGYTNKHTTYDLLEFTPNSNSSIDVGASKKNNKHTKHKNKRGIHEKK